MTTDTRVLPVVHTSFARFRLFLCKWSENFESIHLVSDDLVGRSSGTARHWLYPVYLSTSNFLCFWEGSLALLVLHGIYQGATFSLISLKAWSLSSWIWLYMTTENMFRDMFFPCISNYRRWRMLNSELLYSLNIAALKNLNPTFKSGCKVVFLCLWRVCMIRACVNS